MEALDARRRAAHTSRSRPRLSGPAHSSPRSGRDAHVRDADKLLRDERETGGAAHAAHERELRGQSRGGRGLRQYHYSHYSAQNAEWPRRVDVGVR